MGFTKVYRYTPGKVDWFASGMSGEGRLMKTPRAGDIANREIPRCGLQDRASDVLHRLEGGEWQVCVVVNENNVVLGMITAVKLRSDPQPSIEAAMDPAPTTVRPSMTLAEIADYLRRSERQDVLVTTSDGELIGIATREVVESRVHSSHQKVDGQT
jgi:Mg/Co/Ni transporter MgtE